MSSTSRRWLLGVLVAVLAISAIVLTLLALDHVRTRPTNGDVAPVPTFTQLARATPSPTPSETTATLTSYDRSQERFLTVSAEILWRGTAGQCGAVEPLLERSTDGGETWTDVTPRYLGIAQLVALNPFADGQAEMIALMGVNCEVQALRTFTQGQFWEAYEDVLGTSLYVDPRDPGSIVRAGSPVAAPCSDARSLHSTGTVIATVCEGAAYLLDQDATWRALPTTNVGALNVDGDDIIVAHDSDECNGVALTRFAAASGLTPEDADCADADATIPTAIAVSGDNVLVWSGETTTVSSQ